MCAVTDPNAAKALKQLPKLRGCQLHVTAMLSNADLQICKKLGIELTNDTAITIKEQAFYLEMLYTFLKLLKY